MEMPEEFDSYAVVILRRPEDAPELPQAEAEALQERHRNFIMSLVENGSAYAGGPFTDHSDPSLRGLTLFALPLEEARAMANEDPAVRAGQLVAESYTWWMPAGQLSFTE
jgi:uncharacterized protein